MIIKHPLIHSFLDYPSPDGVCTTVFIIGCDNNCVGCSNPQFKEHNQPLTKDNDLVRVDSLTLYKLIIKEASRCNSKKIVFVGGDPLSSQNFKITSEVSRWLIEENYETCIYTGLTTNQILSNKKYRNSLKNGFTFIKTGLFIKEKFQTPHKTNNYIQFASSNQELLDSEFNCITKNGIYLF